MTKRSRRAFGLVLLGVLTATFVVLWLYSSREVRQAETEFPPIGQFVTVEGVRLHYVCEGSGRPVVLLHGNAGFLQDYSMTILDGLAQEYRACAFDRPGHGYSERPSGEAATPEVQARLLHEALQELGIGKPMLVGHSWSGALVLDYALEYPEEVSGITFLAGVVYGDNGFSSPVDTIEQVPVLGGLVRHTLGVPLGRGFVEQSLVRAFSPDPVPEDYQRAAEALWTRPEDTLATAEDDTNVGPALNTLSPHYSEIQVPVTIVTGDSDSSVDPEQHAYPLHRAVPDSELIVLPGAGHEMLHTRPQETISAIRETWKQADT